MATVTAFIRVSTKKVPKAKIRFRLTDGRDVQLFHKSEIQVKPELWDSGNQMIKAKVLYKDQDRTAFNKSINDRKDLILTIYDQEPIKSGLTSEWLDRKIDENLHPEKYKSAEEVKQTFFEAFNEFLEKHKLSEVRKNNYRVVLRALQRFELYTIKKKKNSFKLSLDTVTPSVLADIDSFLRTEHTFYKTVPEIYKAVPETRTPQPRGTNTVNGIFTKIRTFYHWAIDNGKTQNNPFKGYSVAECVFGTPYYISIEERNTLYRKDLSDRPQLEIQRDIFVFQCLIGSRVADLYRLTSDNIINDAVEYIPRKTKEGRPITVRVPLNATAKEILNKYPSEPKAPLLPFISMQKYNKAIKKAFELAGLTRMVTVLNPTTREEEKLPLNKIASSHLARRVFIGNLYNQVQDPNLIGALTGHKEGSKAFARYREIDEQIKIGLVNLLD